MFIKLLMIGGFVHQNKWIWNRKIHGTANQNILMPTTFCSSLPWNIPFALDHCDLHHSRTCCKVLLAPGKNILWCTILLLPLYGCNWCSWISDWRLNSYEFMRFIFLPHDSQYRDPSFCQILLSPGRNFNGGGSPCFRFFTHIISSIPITFDLTVSQPYSCLSNNSLWSPTLSK